MPRFIWAQTLDLEVFRSLVVPIFAVICIIAWFYMRKRAEQILGKIRKNPLVSVALPVN